MRRYLKNSSRYISETEQLAEHLPTSENEFDRCEINKIYLRWSLVTSQERVVPSTLPDGARPPLYRCNDNEVGEQEQTTLFAGAQAGVQGEQIALQEHSAQELNCVLNTSYCRISTLVKFLWQNYSEMVELYTSNKVIIIFYLYGA